MSYTFNPFTSKFDYYQNSSIGGTITGLTEGSVLFGGVGGILQQDNANFFWDDTNNRLGIGLTNPDAGLTVSKLTGTNNVATFTGSAGSTIIDQYGNFLTLGTNPTVGPKGTGVVSMQINNTGNTANWALENNRNAAAGSFEFNYNGSTKMVFLSGGNVGIGTITPGSNLAISGSGISGSSQTSNFLNVTGTLPSTLTSQTNGIFFDITSAGSSNQIPDALRVVLESGYTGPHQTRGAIFENFAAGTGTAPFSTAAANYAFYAYASSVGTGTNVAAYGQANSSSGKNYGVIGRANESTNSPANNIAVAGQALNGTINVGGFFGLLSSEPTFVSSALIADNGAVAAPIFIGRDNGTEKFRIDDGGNVGIGTSAPATTLHVSGPHVSGIGVAEFVGTGNISIASLDTALSTAGGQSSFRMKYGAVSKAEFGYDKDTDATYFNSIVNIPLLFLTNNSEKARISAAGNLGVGTGATVSAKLHVLGTTEQLRLGYDTSNYYKTTVGSTGGVTFDAVGSGAGFTFSDSGIFNGGTPLYLHNDKNVGYDDFDIFIVGSDPDSYFVNPPRLVWSGPDNDNKQFWFQDGDGGDLTVSATFSGYGASIYGLNAGNISGGTLAIARGGTNATSYGANRVIFMNSGNSAFSSSTSLIFDGSKLGVGTTPATNTIGHFYTSTSGVSNKLMLETVTGSNAALSLKAGSEWWMFAGSSGNSGVLFLYNATNGVYVMGADPVSGYVSFGATGSLPNAQLAVQPSFVKQSFNQYGSYNYINYNPASTEGTYAVYGMLNQAIKNGSSNMNAGYAQIVGSQQAALNTGSGNLDGMTGGYFAVQNIGTGTVTSGLGLGILTPTAGVSSPITTMKGLYIQTMATTGVTNSYGIYIDSGSQYDIYSLGTQSSFAGTVAVADDAYASSWNGSTNVPTKNAIWDAFGEINSTITNVVGSVSGSADFTMPLQRATLKKVIIYCNTLNGTATYTYPTAFTHTPFVLGPSAGLATSVSTTAITVTGTASGGFLEVNGF